MRRAVRQNVEVPVCMQAHRDSECGTPMRPPLVMHIVHRLALGGLENGLVNLINWMPPERYRHAIVCVAECTNFRERIKRDDVAILVLGKRDMMLSV